MNLLIIENDTLLNSILTNHLRQCGYKVDSCLNILDGLSFTKNSMYDCIIADTTLPINTPLFLEMLKVRFTTAAVLLITVDEVLEYTHQHSAVVDYLKKPFSIGQLTTKLKLLLKKNQAHNNTLLFADSLSLNTLTHTVKRCGKPILLTETEFALLEYMLLNKNKVLSREQIFEAVWSLDQKNCSNIVDVYIRYLRKKIDSNFDVKLIHTIRKTGYILKT